MNFFYDELNNLANINAATEADNEVIVAGNLDQSALNISANIDNSENENEYIYGKLNIDLQKNDYTGGSTSTADVNVDSTYNIISVDVIKVPHKLSIKEAEDSFTNFDGSSDIVVDLTPYAKKTELFNSATLTNNVLKFYDRAGNLITSIELSGFVQEQSNLAETDSTKETFVKNKSTIYLTNAGDPNPTITGDTSKYATENYVNQYGGKIDTIKVNGTEQTIVNKVVDLTINKTTVDLANVTNDAQVKRTEIGVANGVATLDSNSKVPLSQLPTDQLGKVDDVKINDTSVVTNKIANITYETSITGDSNNAATTSAIRTFVNSSIATETANFIGTFNIIDDLGLTRGATHAEVIAKLNELHGTGITNNDYCFVAIPDVTVTTQIAQYDRYKYKANASPSATWDYEYTLNNSSFTASQWAAINSGIDSTKVTQISTNTNNIATNTANIATLRTDVDNNTSNITTLQSNLNAEIQNRTNADTTLQNNINTKQNILTAGSNITITNDTISATDTTDYDELSDKPIINADLSSITGQTTNQTYRHIGTTTSSFVQNKLYYYDSTLWNEIGAAVTKTSELTNDSGFITKSVNNLDNYTLTNNLATVATSGSYNDLSNKPTIPTVNDATLTIQKNSTTIDTFTANSATDKTINVIVPTKTSDITNDSDYITTAYHDSTKANATDLTGAVTRITTIEGKIPNAATSSNQLADKAFVNSSIQNMAAFYVTKRTGSGTSEDPYQYVPFSTKNELNTITTVYVDKVAKTPGKNDYAIILADESQQGSLANAPTTRYIYTKQNTETYDPTAWEFQYIVNNTGLTAAQAAALNSGITSIQVGQITTNQNNVTTINNTIANYGDIVTHNMSEFATVATSGSYNDLLNKPTIPIVNNVLITFTQGGVTKGSFTTNQSSAVTIALDKGADITSTQVQLVEVD